MNRRKRKHARSGVIIVLTAVLMAIMVGVIAFAADCGTIALARTQLQAAADSAAIAGTDALIGGTSVAQSSAQNAGQANQAGGASVSIAVSSDVQLGTWNSSTGTFTALTGTAQSNASAVKVTCRLSKSRGNGLTLFFAPIFGISTDDVSASAVATQGPPGCGPFVGLNGVQISGASYTDSYNSNSGAYLASSAGSFGNVCTNGQLQMSGGSYIKGDGHPGSAGLNLSGGAYITGSSTTLSTTLTEAAVDTSGAAASNNNANIPLSAQSKNPLDGQRNFSLSGGDSVTLPAGTYYFAKFQLSGGSFVNLGGAVTIYTTDQVDLSGGTVTNTGAIPSNFKLYSTGSQINLSGSSVMYAEVYAPGAAIARSGQSDFYGSLIGASLNLSGGGGLHYDTALGIGATGSQLVQ
jgi:Flp pilus assembly protein TadG